MAEYYLWLKAFHIISVIAWMAGMFYLPRLFVYHCAAPAGSDLSETFKVMERRLLRAIMTPAMVASWAFGIAMIVATDGVLLQSGWLHAKLALVVAMSGLHGYLAQQVSVFARDANRHEARFFRIVNEVPTVLVVAVVILAVIKPF
ncbi:protoporphyrinogen oxidase HemJ [Kaustia mangrovi]|uniref:Protoporphyrinogen IX oxidase n=1 Tax=Kaustia mangrovi TaxID=2593653 RepID=A0A7S8C4P9_9HYPH|nr:protoporphyrinogen oxidase HemJ [Kaustia mangrovi]QPC43355.1 protoporphyrinogen oxidase HemJ [Kaustia mangrovi]